MFITRSLNLKGKVPTMKKSITFYDFERAFIDCNRENNFSYSGKKALFDYLEEYEEDMGEEIELDVIAICCEFSEYENVQEFVGNYSDDYVVWDIDPDDEGETEEENGVIDYEATIQKIGEYTRVIDIDGESFIIQDF